MERCLGDRARSDRNPMTSPPAAHLRARTRFYERHVLAWYALGRVHEARAAWAAVCELRSAA
jgi:hypothetical protein